MWFELFKVSFDETIEWALNAVIFFSVAVVALELIVNRICDFVEKRKGKHIRIVLFSRFTKEIEL